MWHFHKWESVIRVRTLLQVTSVFGFTRHDVSGLRILEVCTKCGNVRAFLMDGSGENQEKVPETIFGDADLQKANDYFLEHKNG